MAISWPGARLAFVAESSPALRCRVPAFPWLPCQCRFGEWFAHRHLIALFLKPTRQLALLHRRRELGHDYLVAINWSFVSVRDPLPLLIQTGSRTKKHGLLTRTTGILYK